VAWRFMAPASPHGWHGAVRDAIQYGGNAYAASVRGTASVSVLICCVLSPVVCCSKLLHEFWQHSNSPVRSPCYYILGLVASHPQLAVAVLLPGAFIPPPKSVIEICLRSPSLRFFFLVFFSPIFFFCLSSFPLLSFPGFLPSPLFFLICPSFRSFSFYLSFSLPRGHTALVQLEGWRGAP